MRLKFLFFPLLLGAILQEAPAVIAQPLMQQLTKQTNLCFLENKGQIVDQYGKQRTDIDFRLAANGMNVFIGDGQIHYQWNKIDPVSSIQKAAPDKIKELSKAIATYRMDVTLVGANKNVVASTTDVNSYTERYFLPQCGANGVAAHSYKKITYREIYPDIDWVIYVKDDKVEYDFVVRPGGNTADIKLKYDGATTASMQEQGSFLATTPMGSVKEQAPSAYQENGQTVPSRFVLTEHVLSFQTNPYQGTLIIDPTLVWGTYYGGNGLLDGGDAIATDSNGNVYLYGMTYSTTNIATTGAYQTTLNGSTDGFLVKFTKQGMPLWGTYYGGNDNEYATGLACDTLGHVYVSGHTSSTTGIATINSHQPAFGGGGFTLTDAYLAQFDTTGARIWATYYGGTEDEFYPTLACDGASIYMAGTTASTNAIATGNSFQPANNGDVDAFLAKFNSAGVIQWATYYGGVGAEGLGGSVACDKHGDIYLWDYTPSTTGIATIGSYQPALSGASDCFLAKFDGAGARLWGTYYGGPNGEALNSGQAVICDNANNVYVGGLTMSTTGIATFNTYTPGGNNGFDAFLAKFDSSGARQWASYFGGNDDDYLAAIVCGGPDEVYISGFINSDTGIATTNGYMATYGGNTDAFLAQFNGAGQKKWATYYGDAGYDVGQALAYDKAGYVYMTGATGSVAGIATPGSYLDSLPGPFTQTFLAKFCFSSSLPAGVISGSDSACPYSSQTYSITGVDDITACIWTLPSGWTGTSATGSITVGTNATSGSIQVQVVRCGDTSAAQSLPVYIRIPVPTVITVNGFVLGTGHIYSTYQWYLDNQPIAGAVNGSYTVSQNGSYTVVTTDGAGCVDTSIPYVVTNVGVQTLTQLKSSITVYPNPANDKVYIQSPVGVNIKIGSVEGKLILQKNAAKDIDISQLAPGMYVLSISDENDVLLKTEKLTKLKQ